MTQKIVINRCFGGFSLSPKGIKRYAELTGKECYFFKVEIGQDKYIPLSEEEANKEIMVFFFTVPNPKDYLPKERRDKDGKFKTYNESFEKISISDREIERDDPNLVKVVEELGKEANGRFAELKVVKIPDNVEWEIDEYDGLETIEEKHRSWS